MPSLPCNKAGSGGVNASCRPRTIVPLDARARARTGAETSLVLAPTRWRLRKAVKAVNEVLGSLGLLKHPDKTFVGRTERGFDFLG